jgi:hypothetical protein
MRMKKIVEKENNPVIMLLGLLTQAQEQGRHPKDAPPKTSLMPQLKQ